MSEYLYSAILFWIEPANALRLCSVHNGITQFYLPPTRFIPARAEQGLENFIRNEVVNVSSHFTDIGRMEAWVKLSVREWSWTSTVHDWTCIRVGALTNWASQADNTLKMSSIHSTEESYKVLNSTLKMIYPYRFIVFHRHGECVRRWINSIYNWSLFASTQLNVYKVMSINSTLWRHANRPVEDGASETNEQ